jgi:wobble nucleotide-excising tRNase
MIKKIKLIGNLGIFKNFDWDKEVLDGSGKTIDFKEINIFYGRNYSGKTTLSRIFRAMESGELSDKFERPSFTVSFSDSTQVTQNSLTIHGKQVRVFNEDFVRDNLRFITNPDDNIESFAILGDDNNKIEKEIEALQAELGSKMEGQETGLYAQQASAKAAYRKAFQEHKIANDALEDQLKTKATDKAVGIRYKSDRYGNQNYDIRNIKLDIGAIKAADYQPPTSEEVAQHEKLISEKTLPTIPPFRSPSLNFQDLATGAEALVVRKITESDKIEELVKDAVLNRWVNDGRTHHKGKRNKCAFCDNPISENRWQELEKHFDEESDRLEKDIDTLIVRVDTEKSMTGSALFVDKANFYSKFHNRLDELVKAQKSAADRYGQALDALASQLKVRKKDILNQKSFERPLDTSNDLVTAWNFYEEIRNESDSFSTLLNAEQVKAKEALRLKEVSDYLITIRYQELVDMIDNLKLKCDESEQEKNRIDREIIQKEEIIASKKRELNDEEKGATKVNEYLNNFFGHQFLTLEAKKEEILGEGSKRIRFEVVRDGKKAYHLSEGECSLLAFCYFLAKLNDIDTRDSKPIIWIDDPISSLDSNHIFFVYSLVSQEVIERQTHSQLFISTHNLDFLKFLKRLPGAYKDGRKKDGNKRYQHFIVERKHGRSVLCLMPKYLKEYVTEFNYLFHQIHKCAAIDSIDDSNYTIFYNFANNARKFFEIYLYYKYPDQGMNETSLSLFFGEDKVPAVLIDRINNEYSHLCGVFERGSAPVEVPEMQKAAKQIIERLKEDHEQYSALLKSIGESEGPEVEA